MIAQINNKSSSWPYWSAALLSCLLVFPICVMTGKQLKISTNEIIIIAPDESLIIAATQENNVESAPVEILQTESPVENKVVDLIASFEIIRPVSNNLCHTNNPWLLGEKIVSNDDFVSTQDCFAIRIKAFEDSDIMILTQDSAGLLYKISPNNCSNISSVSSINANESLAIPSTADSQTSVFSIDANSGEERLFFIAYNNEIETDLKQQGLFDIPDICAENEPVKNNNFIESLSALRKSHSDTFDWKTIRFYH